MLFYVIPTTGRNQGDALWGKDRGLAVGPYIAIFLLSDTRWLQHTCKILMTSCSIGPQTMAIRPREVFSYMMAMHFTVESQHPR